MVGLTKVAALETAESGVTVNAIAPGWVLTPLVEAQIQARAEAEGKSFDQSRLELLAEKQPSRQFVTPAQIGDLVVFLCGPAADQIRGQTIGVDGGWTAHSGSCLAYCGRVRAAMNEACAGRTCRCLLGIRQVRTPGPREKYWR